MLPAENTLTFEAEARVPAARTLDENALVRSAQAGSREAFEELVRRYDQDVLRLALQITRRPEDAHDLYQEAFLKVYRNLDRFRFECNFYTWLYRVVTNVCLDHLRRRSSRPEDQAPESSNPSTSPADEDFFDRQAHPAPQSNPERALMGKELGHHISQALARLSARERMVFYGWGFSTEYWGFGVWVLRCEPQDNISTKEKIKSYQFKILIPRPCVTEVWQDWSHSKAWQLWHPAIEADFEIMVLRRRTASFKFGIC